MPLTREINRLLIGLLAAFGLVAVAAAYWSVVGPDTIILREDNPRLFEAEAALRRGHIVDRNGNLLAETVLDENQRAARRYLHPTANSFLGYSSLRYGVGGVEAAFDPTLRGDDLTRDLTAHLLGNLLHRPQVGSDIRLTLNLDVQQAVAQVMAGQTGAVVVLTAPGGDVLSLVSLPTYDPNTLDEMWDALAASPGKPFFNRALQGSYQPGGILQTPLMAAAIVANESLTATFEDATEPVQLADGLQVSCALPPTASALSLRDAFAFACPRPFARLATQLGSESVGELLETFQFRDAPTLTGFVPETPSTDQPIIIDNDLQVDSALGQGELTVTPLQMAVMAAAIINDGNAPHPYTLLETRAPGTATWQPVEATRPTAPYTTQATARQIQDFMRHAVTSGAARRAAQPNLDIGGHATLAYAGNESQAWFVGFVTIEGNQAVAVAVVLENSDDPDLAADIGGTALAAAHEALSVATSAE